MPDVVVLSLGDAPAGLAGVSDAGGCGDDGGCGCGGHAAGPPPRVPVLTCADALRAAGATVTVVIANDDTAIDVAVKPVTAGDARLIIAAASDGEVRAVLRRLIRWYAPAPSSRPERLPANRTVLDLPPVGILPLTPAVPDLALCLTLPTAPAQVAAAVLAGRVRRLDLLRNDGGSLTLHGSLLGGLDEHGQVVPWHGRVEVDDTVLSDGSEQLIACAVANAGPADVGGLPLVVDARADDGLVEVAVALFPPPPRRRLFRRDQPVMFEVRRARGRAVAVTPREAEVPLVDDGIAASLTHKRTWWVEPGAWAVHVP